MMGQHDRSEALFYYFRPEDQVPENHLLRLIDKHISWSFARGRLREACCSSIVVNHSTQISTSFDSAHI
jgi:hypothetical protein